MTEAMARFGITKLVTATILALLGLAGWTYAQIDRISERKADKAAVEQRLDRMENKIDRIIELHLSMPK